MSEVAEPEVVEGTATELVPRPSAPANLFRTEDPVEVIEKATQVANALKGVLSGQRMIVQVARKDHVTVEGWTTLGSMLGVTAIVTHTEPIERGFKARVEARASDGRVVGAAEAICSKNESRWKQADDYALLSMAQTRATSKALKGPLGFVVKLAGYETTPAEEMTFAQNGEEAKAEPTKVTASEPKATEKPATAKQRGLINAKANDAGLGSEVLANVILVAAGGEPRDLDPEHGAKLVNRLLDRLPAKLVRPVLKGVEKAAKDAAIPL